MGSEMKNLLIRDLFVTRIKGLMTWSLWLGRHVLHVIDFKPGTESNCRHGDFQSIFKTINLGKSRTYNIN